MKILGFGAPTAVLICVAAASPSKAQVVTYSVPSGPAASTIPMFARQAGIQVLATGSTLQSKRTRAVRGSLSLDTALRMLLRGSGLIATRQEGGIITISAGATSQRNGEQDETASADSADSTQTVIVTGSRIRGAPSASPTLQITRSDIEQGGFNDLGEVARSIPQNYNGGQNPGIGAGAGGVLNQNWTGGTSLNLRGLGPDATLTLLNGRRLAYGGPNQAVDISAVPMAAVETVEIIADGASALYGSDAVGGVANVITRRRLEGIELTARLGGATEGGLSELDGSIAAGAGWNGGRVLVAYEYRSVDPLLARQRSYLSNVAAASTIFPDNRSHSAFGHVEQAVGKLSLSLDGLYLHRDSSSILYTPGFSTGANRSTDMFTVAPTARLSLGEWLVTAGGSYGEDKSTSVQDVTSLTGQPLSSTVACYCNQVWNAELSAEGALFELPAGGVRSAFGGGYRENTFVRKGPRLSTISGRQASRYAFAEIYVPLISPELSIPLVRALSLNGAVRRENYDDLGGVTTPKIGLIYQPISGVSLKGSWGRSFKAPTLQQQFSAINVLLYPVTTFGGTGFPAGSTVLAIFGGSPTLEPERAVSRTLTLALSPGFAKGLTLEGSWFDIDYTDRVVQPLTNLGRTFVDPAYAAFLARNPSQQLQSQVIAMAPLGLQNLLAPTPYDPAKVVGIAYDNYTNVARQSASGIDILGTYRGVFAGGQTTLTANASWLRGNQQNSAGQQRFQTAGFVYNPVRFRARGGVAWSDGHLSLAAFVNHVAGVVDNQRPITVSGNAFTTFDATARYRVPLGSIWPNGVELALAINNLTDEAPPYLAPAASYTAPYDSTNYSPTGRVVTLSIRTRL